MSANSILLTSAQLSLNRNKKEPGECSRFQHPGFGLFQTRSFHPDVGEESKSPLFRLFLPKLFVSSRRLSVSPLQSYPAQPGSFVCSFHWEEDVEQRLKLVSQLDPSTHLHTLIAILSSPYLQFTLHDLLFVSLSLFWVLLWIKSCLTNIHCNVFFLRTRIIYYSLCFLLFIFYLRILFPSVSSSFATLPPIHWKTVDWRKHTHTHTPTLFHLLWFFTLRERNKYLGHNLDQHSFEFTNHEKKERMVFLAVHSKSPWIQDDKYHKTV